PSDGPPIEVWFFGGSTMWGTGQRDERTIPSRVVREATHAGLNLRAVNYGQPGWGVWQSTLKLIEQVVDGQRPDLVIFYDGINELRPLQNARPGAPWTIDWLYGEDYRRRLEQLHRSPWGVLREYSAWHLAEHLWNLSRRRDWLRVDPELAPDGRLRVRISPAQAVSAQISTQRIYANYAAMIRTARQFAQGEGIAFAAFWQPTVFTKRLLPGETYGSEVFDERAPLVYRAIGERVNELGVNPLTDALDNASSPVLLDVCHLNESGAQIVARRVFQELKPLLKSLDGRDP
ncbi:MAG: SGNH/GDSL hydrolase family protein, partial [Myxococcota bacterium]